MFKKTIILLIAFLGVAAVLFVRSKTISAHSLQQSDVWVIENQKVCKVTSKGTVQPVYYNSQLGEPTSIDATDPFRILVFYQQHRQIEILDNHGSRIGNTINLSSLNLGEVSQVCRSSRGGIWLYHRETNELLLTNSQGSRIISQFSLVSHDSKTAPDILVEANGIIYLGFGNSIERYTPYGVRLEPINISYEHTFIVSNQYLWIVNNGFAESRLLSNTSIVADKFKIPYKKNPVVIGSQLYFLKDGKLNISEKI